MAVNAYTFVTPQQWKAGESGDKPFYFDCAGCGASEKGKTMQTTINAPATKEAAIEKFSRWINQRPGLDWQNYYSDWRDKSGIAAYRSEYRTIAAQKRQAHAALTAFAATWVHYEPTMMAEACSRAFSGRLQFDEQGELQYCTGQYWPTEYRLAAAGVLEEYNRLEYAAKLAAEPAKTYIYHSIADVKRANAAQGMHFFERETMRFFNSKVASSLYGGRYFVTSEKNDMPYQPPQPRLYTVREAKPDGDIETVGDFQQYRTAAEAIAAIKELLKK